MTIAGEHPHPFARQQGGRVNGIAEHEWPAATLQTEMQDELHLQGRDLIIGTRTIREPITEIERVADRLLLQHRTALDLRCLGFGDVLHGYGLHCVVVIPGVAPMVGMPDA